MSRAVALFSRALNAGPTVERAVWLLAEYAAALEDALGGTVEAPWISRRQGAGAEAAPSRFESGSGLPSLRYRLAALAEAIRPGCTGEESDDMLAASEHHEESE